MKKVFWIVGCILVVLVLYFGFIYDPERVIYSPDSYLAENTSFEQAAATVLPSKDGLDLEQFVFYEHKKYCRRENADGETLRFGVAYDEEAFLAESARIDRLFEEQKGDYELFYLDGMLYKGFSFYVKGRYYMVAYRVCTEFRLVSYIVIKDDLDSFLSLTDAFAEEYRHRVTGAERTT